MDLSIAIPSWNTRELLKDCLESVYRSPGDFGFEVIIVDNASDDGSPDMVAEEFPDVKLVRNKINLGFAGACNIAFRHSLGRYFLLLNSDTIVLDNALKSMVDFMDKHQHAGVAGCKLLNYDGSLQRSCSTFPGLMSELFDALDLSKLFPKSRLFGGYAMTWWDFNNTREVDFAGGSCLIIRRDAIEEVGLLDESFFMYTEETDWCYRMWEQGWSIYYYPEARIIHLGGESARKYGNDMLLHLYISRNKFIRKHRGNGTAVLHRMIIGMGAIFRLGIFTLARRTEGASFQRKLFLWSLGKLPQSSLAGPGGA